MEKIVSSVSIDSAIIWKLDLSQWGLSWASVVWKSIELVVLSNWWHQCGYHLKWLMFSWGIHVKLEQRYYMKPCETVLLQECYICMWKQKVYYNYCRRESAWFCRMLNSSMPAYLSLLQDTWHTCYSPHECSDSNPLAVRPVQDIQVYTQSNNCRPWSAW